MVDNNLLNYANTTDNSDIELLDTNNCTGENLGTISIIELRVYGNYTSGLNSANIILRPVFDGTSDGDNHTWSSVPTATGWSSWFNITGDTNAPSTWEWTNITGLDCDVAADATPSFNVASYKIEIRVTYT